MIAPLEKKGQFRYAWQKAFLALLPAMVQHFHLAFRHLCHEARAEAVQEATANACLAYQRLATLGQADRAFASSLANFAVKQVKTFRRVGTSQNVRDFFSELAQYKGRVTLERLDRFGRDSEEWIEAVVEDHRTPVFDQVQFRIDFSEWLARLRPRDRKIALSLSVGNSTGDVARQYGVSAGRVSQLRRELYASWHSFLGVTEEARAA